MGKPIKFKNKWISFYAYLPSYISESIDLSHSFYRYMSEESFDRILKGSFKFNNPTNWWDPFESIMVRGDYSRLNFYPPCTYAACFTQSSFSEAHWKMYTFNNKPCIRVEFNMESFLNFVSTQLYCNQKVENYWRPILYFGNVSYDLNSQTILSLGSKNNKYHQMAVPSGFNNDDYADLLLIKRKAFQWEQEARLIILFPKRYSFTKDYTKIDLQKDSIVLKFDPRVATTFIKSIVIETNNSESTYESLLDKYSSWWRNLEVEGFSYPFKCANSSLNIPVEPIVFYK